MKALHVVGVVLAGVLALAPVLVPELPKGAAGVAPSVLAVVAIVAHALKDAEKEGSQ